jgi:hypothetical protein
MVRDDAVPPPGTRSTRTCLIWADDLLRARFHPGADVTLDDARENLQISAELTRGARLPALIDLRHLRSQSAEARALFAGPEATRVSSAVALVVGSPVTRVVGSFYLGFNRPEVPTRLFTSEGEAETWLRSVKEHTPR